jgi:hypothetical protein
LVERVTIERIPPSRTDAAISQSTAGCGHAGFADIGNRRLGEAIGKSRTSVGTSLQRLLDAGLLENRDRRCRLTEPEAPMAAPPEWVAPVRGTDRAQQHHLT